eukprot:scaffold34673_cov175-Amphora_coffeaeformis.AAC.6
MVTLRHGTECHQHQHPVPIHNNKKHHSRPAIVKRGRAKRMMLNASPIRLLRRMPLVLVLLSLLLLLLLATTIYALEEDGVLSSSSWSKNGMMTSSEYFNDDSLWRLGRQQVAQDEESLFPATTNPMRQYLQEDPLLTLSRKRSILHDDVDDDDDDDDETSPTTSWRRRRSEDCFPRVQSTLPQHWWQSNNKYDADDLDQDSKLLGNLKKTGTTIAGICGANFCVMGADTRATAATAGAMLVADARAQKLHWLTRTVVAAGAGTSADLQHLCHRTAVSLALYERHDEVGNHPSDDDDDDDDATNKESFPGPAFLARRVPVQTACHMLQDTLFRAQGALQAYLIVGGVDALTGRASLRALYPHGSMDTTAYTALGSGGYAAMGVLEHGYRPDLTVDEAVELVRNAIAAGIQNDIGSGSQIDLCIMVAGKDVQYVRGVPPPKQEREATSTDVTASSGVNGFGGGSFVVQRRRVIYDPPTQQDLQQEWRDILEP